MTVNEIEYRRLDIEDCTKTVLSLTDEIKNAVSPDEAIGCVRKYIALERSMGTVLSLSSIRSTQNTADEFYEKEEQYYAETTPGLMEKINLFYKAMLESPFRLQMEKVFGKVAFVNAEISLKTISPEILSLLHEESLLCIEYQKLQGSMMAGLDGKKHPRTRLGRFKTSDVRETRKKAYLAEGKAYEEKGKDFDEIYDKMVSVRTKAARALGHDCFTPLGYLRMTRNCYDPDMVRAFRQQVKDVVVPLVSELKKKQAERLGIERVTIYDDAVLFPDGNPKPVVENDELYQRGLSLYRDMGEQTAQMINKMDEMGAFDLYSRENKMSGGYCTVLPDYAVPYIFANFNGTAGDVEVFTHEGGHAFASSIMLRDKDMLGLSEPTLESCEVHSMSMEFLAWPYLERFYGGLSERAKLVHLIGALEFLPYGCMVDEFQHIVYDNPDMTLEQRHEAWAALEKEYRPYLDFEDLPFYSHGRMWQRQLHIYTNPFYYIDYCLAQTVALEVLEVMLNEGWEKAWEKYMDYTTQGGSGTFVEMVEKAGLQSPFKQGVLSGIVEAVGKYISGNISIL